MPCSIKEANLENAKKHIDINLSGTIYCTQLGFKYNPNLEIINVGSAAALETHATWSEYCATKAAVLMATKCWAEDGIYAVCISPARTKTKMRKSLYPDEDQSTLLDPNDFAKVVYNAVTHKYPSGTHLVIRKQNVQEILAQTEGCKSIQNSADRSQSALFQFVKEDRVPLFQDTCCIVYFISLTYKRSIPFP